MKSALLLLLFVAFASGRIHRLKLEEDSRRLVTVSTFGFLKGGTLTVNVTHFAMTVPSTAPSGRLMKFGFTLDKTTSNEYLLFKEEMQETCILEDHDVRDLSRSSVSFTFHLEQNKVSIYRMGDDMKRLVVSDQPRHDFLVDHHLHRRDTDSQSMDSRLNGADSQEVPPLLISSVEMSRTADGSYQTYFLMSVERPEEEGLYFLNFHNCDEYHKDVSGRVTMTLEITEDNNGNFLTAGEMPVPALYFTFSVLFFIAGVAWFSVLRRSREDVYKIHYLMLVVVFVKSLACLFHGVNMYFIQIYGIHEDAWAVMWYIVYLTRGALMFVTVLLIGAGWAFIKHVLTDREKKLFLIIIPLQVLDRVAEVIVEESEEGNQSYMTWKEIFILVDLLCCGAILFPVVWSIRHLQEASRTDGKAAINLQKLKLFRHFYILVVCYIYFTRIIVYLMKITLPFRLVWLTDMFTELAMMVFFVVTGSKFRPATDNPYLQVPLDSDDEEIEMDEVLTKTGTTENVVRVNQKTEGATNQIKQRESSHEYD